MANYNSPNHHRKSTRLRGYDYSQMGLYFITICTKNKECLFGDIENGQMILNDAGRNADKCWLDIPEHFPNAVMHEHIIMPNHMHGIIELVNDNIGDGTVGANNYSPLHHTPLHLRNYAKPEFKSPSKTIGSIIRGYKIGVTKWFRNTMPDYFTFDRPVWQRNYHDHIIRDQLSFEKISCYIINNPSNWDKDKFYTKGVM